MTPSDADVTQEPPALGNQYDNDRALVSYLARTLSADQLERVEGELRSLGELAGNELYDLFLNDLQNEPVLTRWGAWGDRVDEIEVTDVWTRAERVAAEYGVVAAGYEGTLGDCSRVHQFALAHLFIPSTDMYGCPLAMTDGAASTLLASGNEDLIEKAVPHLTSRDPATFWTSGQWMTELSGGSDVGRSKTTARQDEDGTWRLYGRKWFTSAITANMALALARPEGNPDGGRGLALFYVPIREDDTLANGIAVNRLKDKLGTRKLPTAELDLDGARAYPVGELKNGTRNIAPMLNVTRTWNAVTATSFVRRGLALARDYARKREAFGDTIINHPLHQETLADVQATYEGMLHLSFRVAELLGKAEHGTLTGEQQGLLRLLTPITKLTTGKQVVPAVSELLEAFGGAGYVEDTGLPTLLRDAQVLPIWEGTTNVLSLDTLRAIQSVGGVAPLKEEFQRCARGVQAPRLQEAMAVAVRAFRDAVVWLKEAMGDEDAMQAGARRFALTLGNSLELALTCSHAQWALDNEQDGRSAAAAERLAAQRISHVTDVDHHGAYVLVWDFNCPTLYECHSTSGDGASRADERLTELIDTSDD
ncbi:acyl-CoA dehydrogenase [Longibacter salinarum]|uniref:Acyl-CoA dehydrogenase n=1 Tax=Longibacter salinarum TaxID=1850348 RepID=A0A2A8CW71_9BACT|nr:acyl-CoA dehydrogenase family protein [Longibacter salinarum]PEN12834.1 acyl-CoA dehydrogenase [Longibacter salinarum]